MGPSALAGLLPQPRFCFEEADITDGQRIQHVLLAHSPTAVIHLAAIVGDPACKAESKLARRVNYEATQGLYGAACDAGVSRFIFASTCSNYGLSDSDALLTEQSTLNPLSLYAETKVHAENWLLQQRSESCPPTILRFSTAHGLSPRMRFDLTVNEFARTLLSGQPLDIYDSLTNFLASKVIKCYN
jgi:nucleoside-diphosphate-sugar epimerase